MRQGVVGNEAAGPEASGQRDDIVEIVLGKVASVIANNVQFNLSTETQEDGRKTIISEFASIVPFDEHSQEHLYKQIQQYQTAEQISDFLIGIAKQISKKWEEQFGRDHLAHAYKIVFLSTIDNLWMDHLTSMEDLRTGIGLRGYGQRDPLIEYKNEAFTMFERLISQIDDGIAHRAFRINIGEIPPPAVRVNIQANVPESEVGEKAEKVSRAPQIANRTEIASNNNLNGTTGVEKKKIGRNDPCPCGSGKKWKKCHYPNLP